MTSNENYYPKGEILMETIGLDKLYYASISEDPTSGEETYAVPKPLAKAISAELSVELDINPTFSHCGFLS